MAIPMLGAIRQRHPQAHITWLCGQVPAPLLEIAQDIDELVVVNEQYLFGRSIRDRARAIAAVWAKLFGRRYDAVYVCHSDSRYKILTWSAWRKATYSFGEGRQGPLAGRHHTFEYIRLVSREDGPFANRNFPAARLNVPPKPDWMHESLSVIVAPGGGQNARRTDSLRRWPIEHYVELATRLIQQGSKVIVVGAKSDGHLRLAFQNLPVIDLIGHTTLPQLLGVVAAADAVVSHDTSLIHLTNLVETPLVALFGPTPMASFLFPRKAAYGIWGGEGLACRPCYDGREFYSCPRNVCMESISVDLVLSKISELLNKRAVTELVSPDGVEPSAL